MNRWADLISKPACELGSHTPDFSITDLPAADRFIKLDSNENPFGPSARAIEAIRLALTSTHKYPDDDCIALRRKLAEFHSVGPGQVLVASGSAGVLSLLCQTLLGPGLNAVTSALSFIVYGMAVRAVGARLIETPTHDDGYDLDAILRAINADSRLVFLANPNNPTGTMLKADAVEKFLKAVPGHVVVVLDEAYFEFATHIAADRKLAYSRSLHYVRQNDRVVVLRTFSKAHGLAGLRIGYGLGPAELLGYCARMANTYSVSSVAQAAALAALDDRDHIEHTISSNTEQAGILFQALSHRGYRAVPTAANFVYFDVGCEACVFAARLRDERVVVRALHAWGAPNSVRVTIGTPEQNQIFLRALERASQKTGP
jgi:histidinol-phosphate aminotransferase